MKLFIVRLKTNKYLFQISYTNSVLKNLAAQIAAEMYTSSNSKGLQGPGRYLHTCSACKGAWSAVSPSEQGVHGRWDVIGKYKNNANT